MSETLAWDDLFSKLDSIPIDPPQPLNPCIASFEERVQSAYQKFAEKRNVLPQWIALEQARAAWTHLYDQPSKALYEQSLENYGIACRKIPEWKEYLLLIEGKE